MGSLCQEDAGPLKIGERGGNMPQDRRTAPGLSGTSRPLGRNQSQQASDWGAYSAHFIGVAPAVYHPVGLAPGLSSLSSLSSHIFCKTVLDGGKGKRALRKRLLALLAHIS